MKRQITITQASVLLRDMYCKYNPGSTWEGVKVLVENNTLCVLYKGTLPSMVRKDFRGYPVTWRKEETENVG